MHCQSEQGDATLHAPCRRAGRSCQRRSSAPRAAFVRGCVRLRPDRPFGSQINQLPNVDISDAFDKLHEYVKYCLVLPEQAQAALGHINGTNVSQFEPRHLAEFFILKGEVLLQLGQRAEAYDAIVNGVQICDNLAGGWYAWGSYCDKQIDGQSDISWGVNAIVCYLRACSKWPEPRTVHPIARVLWLLLYDQLPAKPLSKAFEQCSEEVPPNCWLMWIPQLLSSISRPEATEVMPVLRRIARAYPQVLFYPVRSLQLELRSVLTTSLQQQQQQQSQSPRPAQPSSTPVEGPTQVPARRTPAAGSPSMGPTAEPSPQPQLSGRAVNAQPAPQAHADARQPPSSASLQLGTAANTTLYAMHMLSKIISDLQMTQAVNVIEMIVEEIVKCLRLSEEEELLRILYSCLSESLQSVYLAIDTRSDTDPAAPGAALAAVARPVPTPIRDNLLRWNQILFSSSQVNSALSTYREAFARDFASLDSEACTLGTLIKRLTTWYARLTARIAQLGTTVHLERVSRFLSTFAFENIGIPGEQLMRQVHPEAAAGPVGGLVRQRSGWPPLIDRFMPVVVTVRKRGNSYRRLVIRGQDGKQYPFLLQPQPMRNARLEERSLQLLRYMSSILDKNIESRRRSLYFAAPMAVPLMPRQRLVPDDRSAATLEDAYAWRCASLGRLPDTALEHCFAQLCEHPFGSTDERQQAQQACVREICSSMVPDDCLEQFIAASFPLPDEYLVFRQQFAAQLACVSLVCYAFHVAHRAPHAYIISRATAQIVLSDFQPLFFSSRDSDAGRTVPFRLTRNLTRFLGPAYVAGPFAQSFLAAARSLAERAAPVSDVALTILRDLWTGMWQVAQRGSSDTATSLPSERVRQAVAAFMSRIHSVCTAASAVEKAECATNTPSAARLEAEAAAHEAHPVSRAVMELIQAASDMQAQSSIEVLWMPWV